MCVHVNMCLSLVNHWHTCAMHEFPICICLLGRILTDPRRLGIKVFFFKFVLTFQKCHFLPKKPQWCKCSILFRKYSLKQCLHLQKCLKWPNFCDDFHFVNSSSLSKLVLWFHKMCFSNAYVCKNVRPWVKWLALERCFYCPLVKGTFVCTPLWNLSFRCTRQASIFN